MKTSNIELENELFKSVYDKTPEYIKNLELMNFSNEGEFTFILKKEHLKRCSFSFYSPAGTSIGVPGFTGLPKFGVPSSFQVNF